MNLGKIANLKYVVRSGWVIRGVPNSVAETVAAHTFEVMLISMYLADGLRGECADIDVEKVMKMSLLHDVPEVMVGDVVKLVKARAPELFTKIELEVAQQLNLSKYVDLLEELSRGHTLEARIVKLSDILATYLQGIRYLKTGYEDVGEIVLNSRTTIAEMINSWAPEGCRSLLKNLLSNIDVTV